MRAGKILKAGFRCGAGRIGLRVGLFCNLYETMILTKLILPE